MTESNLDAPSNEMLLDKIQYLKTTTLFRASILVPLLMKGYPEEGEHFHQYDEFAKAFGFAFQVADDLEDEAQDHALLKAQGQNLIKNQIQIHGREGAKNLALKRLHSSPLAAQYSNTALLIKKLSNF